MISKTFIKINNLQINFRLHRKRGFSILEVITAIFVLTVGVGGSFSLIHQALAAASLAKQRLIASYLAQEGIEIVRGIRDSTWLEDRTHSPLDWDAHLCSSFPCEWEGDYTTRVFVEDSTVCGADPDTCCSNPNYSNCKVYSGTRLHRDTDGFYSYKGSGPQSIFARKIRIEDIQADKIKIKVEVNWQERGRSHNFSVIEHITNWYKQ